MPHSHFSVLIPALLVVCGCTSANLNSTGATRNQTAMMPAAASPVQNPPAQSPPRTEAPRQSSWTAQNQSQTAPPDRREQAGWSNTAANLTPAELLAESEENRRAGNLTDARLACEQAVRMAPFDLEARYQLARIADDEGRFAEAERIYIGILNQKPGDPDALTSLGWSYYLQGRYDESERCLKQVLAQQPQHQVALNDLGFVYGARGNYDAAMGCFRAAGTEAQAQEAMALVMQSARTAQAGNEEPVSGNRAAMGGDVAFRDGVATAAPRAAPASREPPHATPQAKKLAEDFQRLKAENEKQQQQRRARADSQRISAPSPWNNERPVAGSPRRRDGAYATAAPPDRTVPYGYVAPGTNAAGADQFPGPSDYVTSGPNMSVPNEAAYPGATPVEVNRPGSIEPGNFGLVDDRSRITMEPAAGAGVAPRTNLQAQSYYDVSRSGNDRRRPPVITPGPRRNDVEFANPGYGQSRNPLPANQTFTPLPSSGNVAAGARVPEWPNGPGSAGRVPSDRLIPAPAGQPAMEQPGATASVPNPNSWQDSQAAAAQLGLNAGPGNLGISTADGLSQSGGQQVQGSLLPPNPNGPPASVPAPNAWPQSATGVAGASQNPPGVIQQMSGTYSGGAAQQPAPAGGQYPLVRPAGSPPAVVPSVQGQVYGLPGGSRPAIGNRRGNFLPGAPGGS